MKSDWTVPKVAKYGQPGKDWFVWFRYNGRLKTYKKGINYIKDLDVREKEAEALRTALHRRLREGWNPFGDKFDVYNSELTLIEGAKLGLDKKKEVISERTFEDYQAAVNMFIKGVELKGAKYMLLKEAQRIHIRQIMDLMKKEFNWSNKSYNKKLGYLKAVFSALMQWEIIKDNPFFKIESLPEMVTEANITATDDEMVLIKAKLIEEFPSFYNYVATIFHTGIRPEELLAVTASMVNFKRNEIKLPPEITKTDMYRNVPINKHLRKMLEDMNIESCPGEFYVFGTSRNLNQGLDPEVDFKPGPKQLGRDCASKIWKRLVKTELGIDVNLYSMKHLGGDKKLLAGIELDTVREMYGHTNKRMTERYLKTLKDIYKNQIVDLSPDF